jgi:hypothetical protein
MVNVNCRLGGATPTEPPILQFAEWGRFKVIRESAKWKMFSFFVGDPASETVAWLSQI